MFLAIDVGGTKTDYLLADGTQELARVRGGCIKRMRVDADFATASLNAALQQLTTQAGRSLAEVQRTCVGTAGETVPLVVDWLQENLQQRVAGELVIVGDVEIALDAAFHGGAGVLVLAGTGSNVAGRRADGTLVGAGGWGPALADQGSGNRIGFCALRSAFLARDEGRTTSLFSEALRFWQLASINDLIAFANTVPSPDFSKLSRVVYRCAAEGDAVAREVLEREGRELGYLVRLVIRRVLADITGAVPSAPEAWPGIAFAGSVMENVALVRDALLAEVQTEFPSIRGLDGVVDPLHGALWRARAGW